MIFIKLTVFFLFTMSSFISYTITVQPRPSAGSGNSSVNPPGIVFVRYLLFEPHLLIYDLYKADSFVALQCPLISLLILFQCKNSHQLSPAILL